MTDAAVTATEIDLVAAARWVAEDSLLFADESAPFRAHVTAGDPSLVLIVGENASGKSLFFRVLCQRAAMAGALAVTLSIRERTGAGSAEMSRMRQVMMFGDEAEQSTGATSVQAVKSAFKNLDRPNGSVLGLDEPELGLSDGYANALGSFIGAESRTVPDVCAGTVVVTHNRRLVQGLIEGSGITPTFVHVGGTFTLDEWLNTTEERSLAELLELPDVSHDRWRTTLRLLQDK